MKKIAIFVTGLLFCHPAAAVEIVTSNFSVDSYRFYFRVHLADLPLDVQEGVALSLYTSNQCVFLPPSVERFRFKFNPDSGETIESPEVTTIGTPAQDRWEDGPTDHLSVDTVGSYEYEWTGSIRNGQQAFLPGDELCMAINVPWAVYPTLGLPIVQTPEAMVLLQKSSTTNTVTQAGQVVSYSYRIENVSPVFIYDVALSDDNVDEPPVCVFSGNDLLAPEGEPESVVFCTAEHTVTLDEIDAEKGVVNTATVTADYLDPVMDTLTIPVALFASGFESPRNTVTWLDPTGGGGEIAIGADGRPIIAYTETTTFDLKVAKCLDVQCTAASFSTVHGSEHQLGGTSLAIGHDGLPVISYRDETDAVLLVAKCNDDACNGGDETISLVDDGNVGRFSSIAIGTDGLPVISYFDLANGKLKVASCNDPACAGEDEIITTLNDPEPGTGINTSIAIGADGFPVISYQSGGPWDGTLKVAKCNDASCAGGDETITTLDTTGGALFESTSLVIGLDENPAIAYLDGATNAITVAKCNDPACAGGDEHFAAVDSSTAYMRLSMALGVDGNPVISYEGSLSVAKCNDPACVGEDESTTKVDSTAGARTSSIAIGVDGLPIISYWDFTTGGLKVAHCGTPKCK